MESCPWTSMRSSICCLFIYCQVISSEYVTTAFSLPATERSCATYSSNWICHQYRKWGRKSHTLIYVMRKDGTSDSVKPAVACGSSWRQSSLLQGHHLIDSGASGNRYICLRNTFLRRQHHHARLYPNQCHIASSFEIGHLWNIWLCELKHSLVYLRSTAWHSGYRKHPTPF